MSVAFFCQKHPNYFVNLILVSNNEHLVFLEQLKKCFSSLRNPPNIVLGLIVECLMCEDCRDPCVFSAVDALVEEVLTYSTPSPRFIHNLLQKITESERSRMSIHLKRIFDFSLTGFSTKFLPRSG